jgi:hypothetical protein
MPCYAFKIGNATGFICTPRERSKPCKYCGRPSSKLCDYPLRGAKAGKTCDIPMCDRCATHIDPDSDYCKAHAEEGTRLARKPFKLKAES